MSALLLLCLFFPSWSQATNSTWQLAEFPTTTQVLKLLNSQTSPAQFYLTAQKTPTGTMIFQMFYQLGTQPSATAWQVRKAATVAEALAFVNSQGAFAKTPEKEFRICGDASETPSFWVFYRKYEGRTPEAARGQWNWKEEAFGRAEEVLSFLTRRRDQELLTDVEITGVGDKFHVFYRAPRLYDAPGMPAPVWHWLKRENAAHLLEVLQTGTGRENRSIQHARIATLHEPSGTGFYLFY